MSSGYTREANHNRYATIIWQTLTVLSLIALAAYMFYAFRPDSNVTVTWESMASRAFLAVTFGVFAAYCSRQADKSHFMARRNRKIGLELQALGAYLAPLPQDQQHEFRLKLAELLFGKEDGKMSADERSPASVLDHLSENEKVLTQLLSFADRVRKPST